MFLAFLSLGGRLSMFRQLVVCLLLVAFVSGQTAPPAAPAPAAPAGAPIAAPAPGKAPETPPPPTVNPDDPVITIKNLCTDPSLNGDACKTVITKAQFEKLADALQPNMSPAMRRQLATAYARMLAMSSAAEKRELDKTPHFEEATKFARMQILSQELGKALQTESGNVSDQDIQDYYQKNQPNFEVATFARIFVPHTKRVETPAPPLKKKSAAGDKEAAPVKKAKDPSDEAPAKTASAKSSKKLSPEEQQKQGEEAMKAEAAALRKRLVAGEDPDKLEKAAFVAGGLPGTPPPTKMEKVRRTSLPPTHQSVMDLKPGKVSEVISDPSGNYIYKMISKELMPLESAKTEIKNTISAQRYREAMQRYQNNADLNDAYFGAGRGPGMPMPPRGPRPPQQKPEDDDRD
jgi:hypothetical protein